MRAWMGVGMGVRMGMEMGVRMRDGDGYEWEWLGWAGLGDRTRYIEN